MQMNLMQQNNSENMIHLKEEKKPKPSDYIIDCMKYKLCEFKYIFEIQKDRNKYLKK